MATHLMAHLTMAGQQTQQRMDALQCGVGGQLGLVRKERPQVGEEVEQQFDVDLVRELGDATQHDGQQGAMSPVLHHTSV